MTKIKLECIKEFSNEEGSIYALTLRSIKTGDEFGVSARYLKQQIK